MNYTFYGRVTIYFYFKVKLQTIFTPNNISYNLACMNENQEKTISL